jgi:hypothetical protein
MLPVFWFVRDAMEEVLVVFAVCRLKRENWVSQAKTSVFIWIAPNLHKEFAWRVRCYQSEICKSRSLASLRNRIGKAFPAEMAGV